MCLPVKPVGLRGAERAREGEEGPWWRDLLHIFVDERGSAVLKVVQLKVRLNDGDSCLHTGYKDFIKWRKKSRQRKMLPFLSLR